MRTLCKISVAVGALCVVYTVVLTALFELSAGEAVVFAVGAAAVCWGVLRDRMSRRMRRGVAVTASVAAVFFAATVTAISVGARDTATGTEDYLLVLGGGIDGEEASPSLAARLDRALEYASENPRATIVVSGGVMPRETVSEAAVMKRYMVTRGVEPSRIVEEGRSRNTRQNMEFTKAILDSLSAGRPRTVACATSRYHAMRSHGLARRAGMDVRMVCAPVPWYMIPSGYAREVLSVVKYFIEGIR